MAEIIKLAAIDSIPNNTTEVCYTAKGYANFAVGSELYKELVVFHVWGVCYD